MSGARKIVFVVAWVVVYAALGAAIAWFVSQSGVYPSGVDTMCHVYKGDVLYRDIAAGDWWPLYDPLWYNGVEMMRYWAPLPVYVLAGCEAVMGGSPIMGYLLFVGVICFIGGVAWLFVGLRLKRPWLGAFLGVMWFFLPNNLIALFYEGNLPRSICLVLLPVFLYLAYSWMQRRDWRTLAVLAPWFSLMALCHSGFAGMVALAFLVYVVVWGIVNRDWRSYLAPIGAMLCGYLLIGVWLVPSLIGGITSSGSNVDIAADFFQPLLLTINPVARLTDGPVNFYFGAAALVLAVFGGFMATKKAMPGFWAAIVILICTSSSLYPALMLLPFGGILWMLRFVSIALGLVFFSFLLWKSLRTAIVVGMCVLLVIDAVPSLPLIVGGMSGTSFEERMDAYEDELLIGQAQDLTTQRLALIDGSFLDAVSAYLVTGYRNPVATTYGAAWQSSTISTNFMNLDRSVMQGQFLYTFDRARELGNDTVLVRNTMVDARTDSTPHEMDAAAAKCGYRLIADSYLFRLYHLEDAPSTWGTVNEFAGIVIGSNPGSVSLSFPALDESSDTNLSHYTFDDLSRYGIVYITDFTYNDLQEAEDLIRRLSEAGTRVVITADGIPEEPNTHDRIFCGVRCNTIEFSNGYPELDTIIGKLNCDLFPQGYTKWQTVYLEGLEDVWGSFDEGDTRFDFYGTAVNDDVVFVGLNLSYHLYLTRDPSVERLLEYAMDLSPEEVPVREIVPVDVAFAPDSITVSTGSDNVNTTLARHDIFDAENAPLSFRNNLTYVDAGTTTIQMHYPYFWQGLAASVAGLVALVLLCLLEARMAKRQGGKAGAASAVPANDGRSGPAGGGDPVEAAAVPDGAEAIRVVPPIPVEPLAPVGSPVPGGPSARVEPPIPGEPLR